MRKNNAIEFESVRKIEEFNNGLLAEHVQYCYERSAFYRRMFDEAGVGPDQIRTKEDLRLLPLTTKEDLEEFGEDFLCVDSRAIVDMCQTSGTTGRPVILSQTESDLGRVGYNEKISFEAAGITEDDRVFRKFLGAGMAAEAIFIIDADSVIAREYCNLHGLWKS